MLLFGVNTGVRADFKGDQLLFQLCNSIKSGKEYTVESVRGRQPFRRKAFYLDVR